MITRGLAGGHWSRRLCRLAFALAIIGHLVALYLPTVPDAVPTGIPGADKAVHVLVFAAVMATGILAGLRPAWLAVVLALHAPLSEVIQEAALPGRGAEVGDVVADLGGIVLGWYLAGVVLRHRLGSDPSGAAADHTGDTGHADDALAGDTDLSADGRSPSGGARTGPPPS